MKRAETTNTFNNGLVMDIHPLVAPNDSVCNALNATLITFNGNENALQCDMGNGRVETAYLPEGYIPIGTTELGGIIYIVSYNPLIDKCQIGSFPSPERNITSDEVGIAGVILQNSDFVNKDNEITNLVVKRQLSNFTLNPGDKFLVSGSDLKSANLSCFNNDGILEHNYLKLSIATIDSNGRTVYLKDLIKRPYKEGKYINIHSGTIPTSETIDGYRDKVGCNYDIFNSKIAGNLYLIAELEVVDTFTVNWEVVELNGKNDTYTVMFYFNTTSSNGVKLSKIYTNELNTASGPKTIQLSIFNDYASTTIGFPINENPSIKFTPCMPFGICKWLETTINIDSSLLGTGQIFNNIWQYYKEPSQMVLSYNLDCYLGTKQNIEYVRHYFIPCTEVDGVPLENIYKNLDKYFYYELPKRKAYSGHYNSNIAFQPGFGENNLYLVVTTVKKITEKTPEFSYLLHWLYTNGIFNQEYIKQTSDNFDTISLPLEYKVTSNPNMEGIVEKYTKEESKYLYSTAPTGTIKGKTILEVSKDKVDLNLKLGFQNNYNLFEVDQVSLAAADIKTYLSYTANQLNTGGSNVDTDYVKISQNVDNNGSVLEGVPTGGIDYLKTTVNTDGTSLKISGKFYNPIAADTIERNVKVENYYAPVLHTTEDLYKYGLSIDNNGKFQMETTFVGLGMSNGGTDNQGGGGIRHVNGIVDLGMDNNQLQQVSAVVQTGTDDSGNSGYDRFPDQDFSNYVNDVKGGRVIIPVLLVNAGTKSFTLKGGGSLQFSEVGDRPKESGKRVAWFKDAQESSYRYLWIFIKTSNETIITYSPLNDFFKITNLELTGPKPGIDTSLEFKLADLLGSFLSQLFVKRTSQELPRYTVKDISYFDNLIEHINIKGNINIRQDSDNTTSTTPHIKINGVYLNNLYNTHPADCLTYKDLNVEDVKLDIIYDIPVKNLLFDTYLEYQSGALGITDYVYNPRKDVTFETPINKDNNAIFYTYGSNQTYIEPIGPDFFCHMVGKVTENSTGILSISQESIGNWFYNIKKLFTFNNRTQELVLNNSAYNKEKIFYGRWGSYQNESDGNWTAFKNISVFNKQAAIWATQ